MDIAERYKPERRHSTKEEEKFLNLLYRYEKYKLKLVRITSFGFGLLQ
jgi:hypothetical protein